MFQEFRGNFLSLVERSICLRAMNTATAGFRLSRITLISKSARIAQTKSATNSKKLDSLRLSLSPGRCHANLAEAYELAPHSVCMPSGSLLAVPTQREPQTDARRSVSIPCRFHSGRHLSQARVQESPM